MKRKTSTVDQPTTVDISMPTQNKRLKTTVEKQQTVEAEKKGDNTRKQMSAPLVPAVVVDGATTRWYEWPWARRGGVSGGVVLDEQMSWGAMWFPSWDVDFMGEDSHHALYSDVVWDDDIWDLKSINQVPT
ncbi:hypothetical protein Ancab_021061 [Ancistrocladus abbreviatus]